MNQFLIFQGYELHYIIEKIHVYSILKKDIWVIKNNLFFPSTLLEAPTTPWKLSITNFIIIVFLSCQNPFVHFHNVNKNASVKKDHTSIQFQWKKCNIYDIFLKYSTRSLNCTCCVIKKQIKMCFLPIY